MPGRTSRRLFLSTAALGAVAGCLGEPAADGSEPREREREDGSDHRDDESDADEETCDIETGEWWGDGAPIETAVTIETEPEDDIEEACATAAAEAAFDELNEQTAIELEDRNWVQRGWYSDGGDDGAYVAVESEWDRNGNLLRCPDPAFDVAEARAAVPNEVSVTLHVEETDETYRCTHEIRFEAHRMYLD